MDASINWVDDWLVIVSRTYKIQFAENNLRLYKQNIIQIITYKSRIFVKKVIMGTIELKSELISLIEKIEDNKVLNAIYILLTNQLKAERTDDFWDELPENVKTDIDEAIKEANRGETIPHKEAMRQIRAKIASL